MSYKPGELGDPGAKGVTVGSCLPDQPHPQPVPHTESSGASPLPSPYLPLCLCIRCSLFPECSYFSPLLPRAHQTTPYPFSMLPAPAASSRVCLLQHGLLA